MPAVPPPTETLKLDRIGARLHITLNRPEVKNAINPAMIAELAATVAALRDMADIRIVVLRGAGGNFCTGGDIKEFSTAASRTLAQLRDGNRAFGHVASAVQSLPQVVIAVVEGAAMGGGFGLACIADITLAHRAAIFAMPEVAIGLIPAQIAAFVVRRVGLAAALRLGVTGARCDATEALRLGLVHGVAENGGELDELLKSTMAQILRCAPGAIAATKQLIYASAAQPLEAVLDRAADLFAAAVHGDEGREGTKAFVEKRRPAWVEAVE
jgi:isohexenylglutaconyl-CoA hydratase